MNSKASARLNVAILHLSIELSNTNVMKYLLGLKIVKTLISSLSLEYCQFTFKDVNIGSNCSFYI